MDFTPVTSPPSSLVHDRNANHGRRRSTSRSAAMPFSRAPALAIPGARFDQAPPPLPPPRYIDELAAGSDPGWAWGNDPKGGNFGKAKESAMPMSNFPKSWGKNIVDRPLEMPDFRRRESSTSTVRSPVDTNRGLDFARHQDEGYYSLSGPRPSAMSQQSVYKSSSRLSSLAITPSQTASGPSPEELLSVIHCSHRLYLSGVQCLEPGYAIANKYMNSDCMVKDSYKKKILPTHPKRMTTSYCPRLASPRHHLVTPR